MPKSKKVKHHFSNESRSKIKLSEPVLEREAAKGTGLSSSHLKKVYNFLEYIEMVRLFSKRYTLFIATKDTPCGPSFSQEIANLVMKKLGLKENLYNKFRHSYAAIIDSGDLLFESLSPTISESVDYQCVINDVEVSIVSGGFNAEKRDTALVIVNGKNYSPCRRGMNFVVYDKVTRAVLDAVCFDTYSANFKCNRPNDLREQLLAYKNAHPDIFMLCLGLPGFPKENRSENENFIQKNNLGRAAILYNLDKPIFALNQYLETKEDIIEVLNAPKSYHDMNGVRQFEDVRGKCVNTAGGHRVTVGQPKEYKRSVFIVGGCVVFGVGASDKGTIASYLQALFATVCPEQQIIVHNYGYYLEEFEDAQSNEEMAILNSLPVKPGDIVVCRFGHGEGIPLLNLSQLFQRPHHYGETFFDTTHYTEYGHQAIAEELFKKLRTSEFLISDAVNQQKNSGTAVAKRAAGNVYPFDEQVNDELLAYKNILSEFYQELFPMGAIVVNCNPFTLGHLYLIETAAAQVTHLFVFVVQEDLSIFSFDDRIKLVDEGVAGLDNVTVIPSGRFIISSLTFSEYFNKSELQERAIDSSLDVTIFAREIAPLLNISVRFAGEEPHDKVTDQYNQTMRATLPQYGIKFVEIPRKEVEGNPISASHVRSLLKEKNFEEIRKLVPKSTFDYLWNKFQDSNIPLTNIHPSDAAGISE